MRKTIFVIFVVIFMAGHAWAEEIAIRMHLVNERGIGKNIGTVTALDSRYGLILVPDLTDLAPGMHGFHVHEHHDCGAAAKNGKHDAGLAAGGHLDPLKTGRHEGPYGKGHAGDLPVLYVAPDGRAQSPVLAPRLKVADIKGRALVIHAGGDNYSDFPQKLGGGGGRVACGLID